MSDLLEVLMIISFGLSWPFNIIKAWRAKTAKGTSIQFYSLIWIGYLLGILSKIIKIKSGIAVPGYVVFCYCLNEILITIGIIIYFRNRQLDKTGTK